MYVEAQISSPKVVAIQQCRVYTKQQRSKAVQKQPQQHWQTQMRVDSTPDKKDMKKKNWKTVNIKSPTRVIALEKKRVARLIGGGTAWSYPVVREHRSMRLRH